MVGNTGNLMTLRLVRSKLRKREESATSADTATEAKHSTFGFHSSVSQNNGCRPQEQQQIFTTNFIEFDNSMHKNHNNNINNNKNSMKSTNQEQIAFARTSGFGTSSTISSSSSSSSSNSSTTNWVFPPKEPTPNIYNCLSNEVGNDRNGFRGFRKQFSGRFRRLVAKKPAEPAPAIPPELKPQLKTIYVY